MPVSVIMPARNAEAFIGEAIASVLGQGGDVAELIVVDDGSTDQTTAIAGGFPDPRLRVVTSQGGGVSAARNAGARIATGEWLMFLDADDRLRPGAIPALLRASATQPRAIAIYGDYARVNGNGRRIGIRHLMRARAKPSGQVLTRLAAGNFIVNGGIMIVRAASFADAGGFDETMRYCEDWHCWCRLAAQGEFLFIPDLLLDYRVHANNTMNAALRSPEDFLPAADRVFRDPAVVGGLSRDMVSSLRKAAEMHLITYAATQAIRFRHYRKALVYIAMARHRSLPAMPRVLFRVGMAALGI